MCGKFVRTAAVISLLLFSFNAAYAQTRTGDSEIRFSYGGAVYTPHVLSYSDSHDNSIYSFLVSNLSDPKNVRSSGILSLSYSYFLEDWLSVGGTVGTAFLYTDFEDNYSHTEFSSSMTHGYVSLMAGVRFHFLNKKWVRLYSDVNIGVNMLYGKNVSAVYSELAFQTSPFGISIGKKVSGFLELSIGTMYYGGNIGLSVRF